jgi:hypothetical protein
MLNGFSSSEQIRIIESLRFPELSVGSSFFPFMCLQCFGFASAPHNWLAAVGSLEYVTFLYLAASQLSGSSSSGSCSSWSLSDSGLSLAI